MKVVLLLVTLFGMQLRSSAPVTYASAGTQAVATMEAQWYVAGSGWRTCLYAAGCKTADADWGADSMTYALRDRWDDTHDPNLVPLLADLGNHLIDYHSPCASGSTNCYYSDQPLWDSVAALDAYAVTATPAYLQKGKDAFAYVDAATAFGLGACPTVDYQRANGNPIFLKTLESDSNYIKAALLLYTATSDKTYLGKAMAKYAAVRKYFLDPQIPLYTVYVFDSNGTCVQVPRRFYASVNGNMIWNGLYLYRATGMPSYINDAVATANAVITRLADANGVYADLQAENDIAQPLVIAMHDIAKLGRYTPAATWILKNASAARNALTADGSFGRFWDGPPTPGMVTEFQTGGAFALTIAAADLGGNAATMALPTWTGTPFVSKHFNTSTGSNGVTFTGSRIAFTGTIGEVCCEPGHARVYVDGVETVDGTGIWQNKTSTGLAIPNSILFAWRWHSPGTHTVSFGPADHNAKEGGTYLDITGYYAQ